MAVTDSVSVFAEGTFEEQILELANYIAQSKPESERASYVQFVQDSLQVGEGQTPISEDEGRRKQVFLNVFGEVKGFGEGSLREIEGFFNLLYAHLLTLWPTDSSETKESVSNLLNVVTSSPAESSIKYRILSNLFNALPRSSSLRLPVYTSIIELASANDELEVLQLSQADTEKWLQEWDISSSEKSAFLKALVDAFTTAGQLDVSYKYKLAYVRSLESSSPDAQHAAIDLIATALSYPTLFDFDTLFKLDSVLALKDHELFQLLQVFVNGGLDELKAWQDAHADAEKFGLDNAQLERKMRLLSLAALGFQNIGRELSYTKIASSLQVEVSDVEKWVIDVIRAGLLSGKLSQTTQTLRVVRATARAFERPQWEALEQRLTAWRAGLESVLEVVASAKKRNTQVLAAVAAEGPTNDAEGVAAGPAASEAAASGDVPPAPQPQVVAA
ncbi:hypothetical protein HETIRDRAFT_116256 [Heterobasidion irregulare TC 32-1]|uniref:Eukaryotic translation initiation factor 3 subunit M n=1 Tax=Heterobasidion irregulare (strain TC 32-1) TaxID=747525 RepID=W4KCM8_HETIT|nr:uncharacterized protein HETIRDRAFT_116256 [Heterobasidion irregulare TC 32-1]ETW83622.1 hypothetical protein HETIRDRAFT_116256 [Heterobasidion irregulare TC 32-1]